VYLCCVVAQLVQTVLRACTVCCDTKHSAPSQSACMLVTHCCTTVKCAIHSCTPAQRFVYMFSSDPAAAAGSSSSRGEHSNSRSSSTHDNDNDDSHCNGEDADMADTGGCSARQLISAVLKQCAVAGVALKLAARPPHSFDLRYDHPFMNSSVCACSQ
jgi:hypothetical protein